MRQLLPIHPYSFFRKKIIKPFVIDIYIIWFIYYFILYTKYILRRHKILHKTISFYIKNHKCTQTTAKNSKTCVLIQKKHSRCYSAITLERITITAFGTGKRIKTTSSSCNKKITLIFSCLKTRYRSLPIQKDITIYNITPFHTKTPDKHASAIHSEMLRSVSNI